MNKARVLRLVSSLLWAAVGAACHSAEPMSAKADQDAGACLASLSLDCSLAIEPTYPAIFDNLLLKTCGSPTTGTSCHGPNGLKGGLVLSDMNRAYDYLLGHVDGRARVLPNDPKCSIIELRLESSDPKFRMPPSDMPLSEGLRCAVRQWIQNGALKQ
jgi:hypothetical protein